MYATIIEVSVNVWVVNINTAGHIEIDHQVVSSFLAARAYAISFHVVRFEVCLI